MELERSGKERAAALKLAWQVLFWSACLATLFGILYFAGLLGRWLVDGTIHSRSSPAVQMLSAGVALLWNLSLVVLFAALRRSVARHSKLTADLALLFMTLVCATSSVNWFVQLAIMPRLAYAGESPLTALLDIQNPFSLTFAMEHLGWGLFFGLSTIFAAWAIGGGRLAAWVRGLLAAGGLLGLLHFIGIVAGSHLLSDLGYAAWGLLLPVATGLLAVKSWLGPASGRSV